MDEANSDAAAAHEADVLIPGSFVVFQGVPGDGVSNTISSFPVVIPEEEDDYTHVQEELEDEQLSQVDKGPLPLGLMGANLTSLSVPPFQVATAGSLAGAAAAAIADAKMKETNTGDDSFIVVSELSSPNATPAEQKAVDRWQRSCRSREDKQHKEWIALQNTSSLQFSALWMSEHTWWLKDGKLAVFAEIPRLNNIGVLANPISSLSPGCTVVGTEIMCLDSMSYKPITMPASRKKVDTSARTYPRGRLGWIQLIRIVSPVDGWVTLSIDGQALLGPGLPSFYTNPEMWLWKITCAAGAFVREGLELQSRHVETLPYGSILRVSRKTVNTMGLPRLRVHAVVEDRDRSQVVEGWISEFLNPLSGQRGPIAQPLPFPVPALYRVLLPDGAVIRSDVELSSPQIGRAPMGTILKVIGRAFSETPADQCIERLRLAGRGGWVSVRLNRAPPMDELILEMVDIDGTFDPDAPASYHLQSQVEVSIKQQDDHEYLQDRTGVEELRQGDLSEIGSDDSSKQSSAPDTVPRNPAPRRPIAHTRQPPKKTDDRCLICLAEERSATIVHGETGHIACCLVCARILHGRGERCPVCRLPIDSVIQQFWA